MARDSLANNAPNRSQICSASSGGLARIQFDSDRDVLRAARSRRLVIAICSISLWSCFPSGNLAEERLQVVVYSQGRPTQRRSATRKRIVQRLYPLEREGSNHQLVRRESALDANKKVAKAKWPKSGAPLNDPHPKAGSAVTRRLPLNS